jgi:hypothetical protein
MPKRKFTVKGCPKNAADARPVKIVATVDEYFFRIVSAVSEIWEIKNTKYIESILLEEEHSISETSRYAICYLRIWRRMKRECLGQHCCKWEKL